MGDPNALFCFVFCYRKGSIAYKKKGSRYLHHTILSYPYPTLPPYLIHTHTPSWLKVEPKDHLANLVSSTTSCVSVVRRPSSQNSFCSLCCQYWISGLHAGICYNNCVSPYSITHSFLSPCYRNHSDGRSGVQARDSPFSPRKTRNHETVHISFS